MRSLTLVALSTLAAAVSAQNCNPTYNTTSAGPCFANCNEKAGKELYSDWTNDSTSPHFLKSLSFMCNKGTSEYMAFMTTAGMCMVSCSNPELFSTEFASACAWWQVHRNDTCSLSNQTTTSNSTSSNSSSSQSSTAKTSLASSHANNLQVYVMAAAAAATYFLI
ncbi:hypothetical protein G6F57_007564 [Rhizopus arrhizus]|uniref:Secreted protein n=1 Tax=Rhizopus oryzae TaxID=64495 RepID=A0A9P6XBD0_RHIOR|nr:hypothetical protein G6F24_004971 [Rhizopus arrhizus]KAG0790424.1 hypothetical protein G6F21_005827 [Rhizopus arrhizus]KAG0812696.1 hypothetical protein G6F20_006163 [Rhizopus arrhizus]KAG0832328.1 hypothetical protein G6F19_006299 [Rhizopus arrhizus]KAG0834660.1 hypothetical protein G6F18_006210 [Rhizopus arrhizus]